MSDPQKKPGPDQIVTFDAFGHVETRTILTAIGATRQEFDLLTTQTVFDRLDTAFIDWRHMLDVDQGWTVPEAPPDTLPPHSTRPPECRVDESLDREEDRAIAQEAWGLVTPHKCHNCDQDVTEHDECPLTEINMGDNLCCEDCAPACAREV